jgi:hypothetical protein
MKRLPAFPFRAFVFFVVSLIAYPAFAHASLLSASPAPGETVPPGLARIRLEFDDSLAAGSTIVVYGEGFQAVAGISPQVEGNILIAALASPLAPGAYTVQWKAVSEDGHSVDGSYQFGVSESASNRLSGLSTVGAIVLVVASLVGAGYVIRRRML